VSEFHVGQPHRRFVELPRWTAEITIERPVPHDGEEGWFSQEHYVCPHLHTEPAAADACGALGRRTAQRTGHAPRGWQRA
jgi:hypothetical protein